MRDKKGKLGWTEAGRLHSTFKRAMLNSDTKNTTKDKSKQHKAICDKCKAKFSIRGDKQPKHNITYSKSVLNEEGLLVTEVVTEVCEGNISKGGKKELESYTYRITLKTSQYVVKSSEVTIKKGDKVVAEIKNLVDGNFETTIVEKTIKSIIESTEVGYYYLKTNIIIKCTDGTILPNYVKDIFVSK